MVVCKDARCAPFFLCFYPYVVEVIKVWENTGLAPIVPGYFGCIHSDGGNHLHRARCVRNNYAARWGCGDIRGVSKPVSWSAILIAL
jgi:hypothetical protein